MAEEHKNGAQKGMGELFIDLGVKGLPTLLKGLNSVSATFLLGKNAATQFANTLTQPVKEAGKSAVAFGKMSSSLGISLKEYMKLHLYLKSHNLSDGLLDDLASTADMLTKVHMGIGGISGEFAYAMHTMGLDWQNYDGSFQSVLKLQKDVQNATRGMNEAQRKVLMQAVGLKNPEWKFAHDRGDFDLSNYKTVSDKEVEDLIKSQEALALLGAEAEQLKMHLISKLTPAVVKIAGVLSDYAGKGATGEFDEKVKNGAKVSATVGATVAGLVSGPVVLTKRTMQLAKKTREYWNSRDGNPTGGAAPLTDTSNNFAPPFMQENATTPPNLTNSSTTININNENIVHVNNPQDAGPAVTSINQETLNNVALDQYQAANRPGL